MKREVKAAALLAAVTVAMLADSPASKRYEYAPLTRKAASEVLARVLDTESSLGPLAQTPQKITMGDLVRFHGHPCDGLIASAKGIGLGLKALFPDGIVDRTDIAAATNGSPCYSDAAAYLTGARVLYGTLVIDKSLGDEWLISRRSTGQAVKVSLKPGIKPAGLAAMESRLRTEGCDGQLIREVQSLQLEFIRIVLASKPEALYVVVKLAAFPYQVAGARPDDAKAKCGA